MSTGKGFGVGVNQHMGLELKLCAELLIAYFTGHCVNIHLVCQLVVLLQRLQSGVGLFAVRHGAFKLQFSLMNRHVIFQVILVVELLPASRTEVFVANSLLVNISEVSHQIISEKEFLLADATGDVEIFLSATVSLFHVVVELYTTCESVNIEEYLTKN